MNHRLHSLGGVELGDDWLAAARARHRQRMAVLEGRIVQGETELGRLNRLGWAMAKVIAGGLALAGVVAAVEALR